MEFHFWSQERSLSWRHPNLARNSPRNNIQEGCEIIHECHCTMPREHIVTHYWWAMGANYWRGLTLLFLHAMADAGPPSVGFSENDMNEDGYTQSSTQFRFNSEHSSGVLGERNAVVFQRREEHDWGVFHYCWMHIGASKGELRETNPPFTLQS